MAYRLSETRRACGDDVAVGAGERGSAAKVSALLPNAPMAKAFSGLVEDGNSCGRLSTRLWELDEPALQAVLAIALPGREAHSLARVHRLVGLSADFAHVMQALRPRCRSRNPVAEDVQRLLDRVHALWVGRFSKVASEGELLGMWQAAKAWGETQGALWAALTCRAATPATRRHVSLDGLADGHVVDARYGNVELLAGALNNLASSVVADRDVRCQRAVSAFMFGCLAHDAALSGVVCRACAHYSACLAGVDADMSSRSHAPTRQECLAASATP